jgi:ParB-like chromosome segregation protein Spo0J
VFLPFLVTVFSPCVRRRYLVVDGRHRVSAAQELHLPYVMALVLRNDTPLAELFKMAAGTRFDN